MLGRLRRRAGDGRPDAHPDATWTAHEERGGALARELLEIRQPRSALGPGEYRERLRAAAAWREAFAAAPDDVAGSVLMLLVRHWSRDPERSDWAEGDLARRRFTVTRADALRAARLAADGKDALLSHLPLRIATAMLQRTADGPAAPGEVAVVEALLARVDRGTWLTNDDRRSLRMRLDRMLPRDAAPVADLTVFRPVDDWAKTVVRELGRVPGGPDVAALVRHLASAPGAKPTQAWLGETRRLTAAADAARVVRLLVRTILTAEPTVLEREGFRYSVQLRDENADLARAAVWAAATVDEPWVVETLHAVAAQGIGGTLWTSEKVTNACFVSLGAIGTPDAVAALQRLADATRHNGFRTRIRKALDAAAERAGLTPGQLVERVVPAHDLDPDGTGVATAGGVTARLRIGADLAVTTEWQSGDDWLKKPPAGADARGVAAMKRHVKEVRDGVAVERRRVEGLFADDRAWPADEWRRYYLDHPVTGRLARGLVWWLDEVAGVPDDDGVRTLDGHVALPASGTVRLWHPAGASVPEVMAWREVVAGGLRQPFKQAFREVYQVTPAELATRTYSNRFAAHVLRYQQTFALFKERGWVSNYLGPHDGGYEGVARRPFADSGITAAFEHFPADEGAGSPQLATTDRVWFFRTADRARTALPLDEVPPLVFTEAMRDVDLFVGVTSIAADPTWGDRGADRHFAYWEETAFGQLTATAEVRRDALARLLPMLKVADRVSIDGRHVVVRGRRGTYRIHIGSGNVLMEPSRYLCIVPSGSRGAARLMLPFEGDAILTTVLSKVVLLAADHTITDESILRQMGPG